MTLNEILKSLEDLKDHTNEQGKIHLQGIKVAISVMLSNVKAALLAAEVGIPLSVPTPPIVKDEPKVETSRVVVDVEPSAKGSWNVHTQNTPTSQHKVFKGKADALAYAKKLAKTSGLGQVVVHGKNGKIQYENTYGKDPVASIG